MQDSVRVLTAQQIENTYRQNVYENLEGRGVGVGLIDAQQKQIDDR